MTQLHAYWYNNIILDIRRHCHEDDAAIAGGGELARLSKAAAPGGGGGICTKLIAQNYTPPVISLGSESEVGVTHHIAPISDQFLI